MAVIKKILTAKAQRRRGRKGFPLLHRSTVRLMKREYSLVTDIIRDYFSLRLCASAVNDFKRVKS